METQVQPAVSTQVLESIESFGQETPAEAIQPADMRHGRVEMSDNGLDCFCEVFVRPSILASGLFQLIRSNRWRINCCFATARVKNGSTFGLYIILPLPTIYLIPVHRCMGYIESPNIIPSSNIVIDITRPRTHECH